MVSDPKIIVSLDYHDQQPALDLITKLDPKRCRLKVNTVLFTGYGPAFIDALQTKGFEIFLDLKFHDIPNTVSMACRAAAELGVWMLNVHALGGARMLQAAREGVASSQVSRKPYLIAVTVLTSMTEDELSHLGIQNSLLTQVEQLARMTQQQGLDGVVCSAQEASHLRDALGDEFVLVTPGIRLADDDAGDQRRIVTPAQAVENGSDYLVIGRSITQAPEPMVALERIEKEIL